jgi:uncharacterized protein (DUF433 family)
LVRPTIPAKSERLVISPEGRSGIPAGVLDIIKLGRNSMEVYPGITMDPAVRFGKPCITGTRIDVATVLGRLAAGDRIEQIQEDYQLTRDQVMAALAYATHVAEHLPPAVKSAWLYCSMRIFRYDSTTDSKKKTSQLNIFYSPTAEFTTETS